MTDRSRTYKVAGVDPGGNYVAWAVLRGSLDRGFLLYRHGLLMTPNLGDNSIFGTSLGFWASFFEWFVLKDLRPTAWAVERFTYRPGSQGGAAEDVNLQIPGMNGPGAFLVRNTDWKTWFHNNVRSKEAGGTQSFFHTPTQHEADACGIALYLGSVLLPRVQRFRSETMVPMPTFLRTSQGSLFGPDDRKGTAK
jgi:hypothetical protein